jgi:hypothetical protein
MFFLCLFIAFRPVCRKSVKLNCTQYRLVHCPSGHSCQQKSASAKAPHCPSGHSLAVYDSPERGTGKAGRPIFLRAAFIAQNHAAKSVSPDDRNSSPCDADSSSCDANLSPCDAYSSSCGANLSSCDAYSSSCGADLSPCDAYSSSCGADLSPCDAYSSSCGADLSSCDANLHCPRYRLVH